MFVRLVILVAVAALAWGVVAHRSEGAGRPRPYVVQPGDTLWAIAERKYAGDPRQAVWHIERRNGLSGPTIHAGQTLLLP